MALKPPNYFDPEGFARMRTPSRPYNPDSDYSTIIAQLREARREFRYAAISPQNLVEPALLEPVIELPYYNKPDRAYVDVEIVEASGTRLQWEGCANIKLVRDGKEFPAYIKTRRPTRLILSRMLEGKRVTKTYRDRRPAKNTNMSAIGLICHELDHTKGKLISDIARERFLKIRDVTAKLMKENPDERSLFWIHGDFESPNVLVRDGDWYVYRLASEFWETEVPPCSPDVLYFDTIFLRDKKDISKTFVPREGELLPIKFSEAYKLFIELTAR